MASLWARLDAGSGIRELGMGMAFRGFLTSEHCPGVHCLDAHCRVVLVCLQVKTLVSLSELRYRPPPEWMARFSAALHSRLDVLEAHSLSEVRVAAKLRQWEGRTGG